MSQSLLTYAGELGGSSRGSIDATGGKAPQAVHGTQAGTYTVTVKGTSGSISHTMSVDLIVK